MIPYCYTNSVTRKRIGARYKLTEVVPACRECNRLLRASFIVTIAERATYLSHRIAKRYDKLLKRQEFQPWEAETLHLRDRICFRLGHLSSIAKMRRLTPKRYWDKEKTLRMQQRACGDSTHK